MTTERTYSPPPPAEYDPDFGKDGLAYLQSPTALYPNVSINVVATGPDNKIYIAGTLSGNTSRMLYTLIRLNENGTVDTSFGTLGFFYDYFIGSDSSNFYTEQIAFVNDKILLTGTLYHTVDGALARDKAVVRFSLNGSIDETFAKYGKFIFHAPNTNADLLAVSACNEKRLEVANARCAASNSVNKPAPYAFQASTVTGDAIMLLHDSGTFDSTESWIIRLSPQGELDRSFNGSGFVCVSHDRFPFLVLYSLIIDEAGDYISAGEVRVGYFDSPDALVLVKHRQDGTPDTFFQQRGYLLMYDDDANYYWILGSAVKQPNNRILCIGSRFSRHTDSISGLLISREADGSENTQFNDGKPVLTERNSSGLFWFNAVFQDDGELLTTGLLDIEKPRQAHYTISRFFYNGIHDKTYNGTGWIDYKKATNFSFYSSAIKNNKVVLAVDIEEEEEGALNRAVARGLMP